MSGGALRPADLELHARLGIGPALLAGVRRVTDAEARELLSSRHPGDLAGVWYPYVDPVTVQAVTGRLRRDHPEIENGKPADKYLAPFGDHRHLYFPPDCAALLPNVSATAVFV